MYQCYEKDSDCTAGTWLDMARVLVCEFSRRERDIVVNTLTLFPARNGRRSTETRGRTQGNLAAFWSNYRPIVEYCSVVCSDSVGSAVLNYDYSKGGFREIQIQ